jgi:hypothetical protein
VFDKIGNDANGNKLTTDSFIRYLTSQRPRFYDGLQSRYCHDALTPPDDDAFCNWWLPSHTVTQSIGEYMSSHSGVDAITGTPSYPLLTFFRPDPVGFQALGRNLGNEAVIFHEALHGISKQFDNDILTQLGMDWSTHPSCSIAIRIENAVLKQSSSLNQTDTWSCPNQVGDE